MKFLKTILAASAATAMLAAPVVASAAPVSKLSISKSVRAGTAGNGKASKLEGASTIIAIVAAAAVIGGIALAAGGKSKSK